ncbi:MAG: tetratricopeptide repeat protein [Desulfohalobiaceae bacterium]|nr:tetratricopeptide repeat protein [Desulfohalobiaceae bacterium]
MTPENTNDKGSSPVTSEINEQVGPLVKKITENLKQIGIVFGAIIILAAAVTGYKYYRVRTLEKGQAELGRILLQVDQKQLFSDLKGFLEDAPGRLKPAIRLHLASQAMDSGQYEEAGKYWETIAAQTKKQDLKVVAGIGQANALHLQGRTAEGLQMLTRLRQEAPERYLENVNQTLATMAETTGNWDKALQAYQQLKAAPGKTAGTTGYLQYKIKELQQKTRQGKSS